MANARSIEVKVGVLILTAVGLLAAFLLVMGGINFQPTYKLNVDFDNPGGLQVGAPVKIAGVKVGKIEQIEFRGGKPDEVTGRRQPLVRIGITIEKRYQDSVFENSLFYVTTQGVLGEQFLAIDPGSSDRPVLPENPTERGPDPPRLDMLLAEGYELLHSTVSAVRDNREQLAQTFDALRLTLRGTGTFFANNQDRLDRIVVNVEQATVEGNDMIRGANEKFVKNEQIDRILRNVDVVSSDAARQAPPLLADARHTMNNVKRLSDTVGSEAQQRKIERIVDDTATLVDRKSVV